MCATKDGRLVFSAQSRACFYLPHLILWLRNDLFFNIVIYSVNNMAKLGVVYISVFRSVFF
jgi:hypothetical protein